MLQINTLTRLDLGVKQENLARDLYIDMSAWIAEYPNGSITVWHKRNGDETKYAVSGATFDRDSNVLTWTPTAYDTFYQGQGLAEIRLTENDVIKKTKDIVTETAKSLMLGSGETLEAGWQNLIDTMAGYASDAQDAADDAEDAKDAAEDAQEAAELAQDAAEDAQEAAEAAQTASETAQGKAEDAQTAAEAAQSAAEAAMLHYPYVNADTGYWMVWDPEQGVFVSTGVKAQGNTGAVPNISVGTVTTLQPDKPATVERRSGSPDTAPVFDFGIPKGDTGTAENIYGNSIDMSPSDTTKVSEAIGAKADKVTGGTENNFAALDASGNLKDSGHKHGDYATKVTSPTENNFAALDGNGNLKDSGKKAADFILDSTKGAANGVAELDANGKVPSVQLPSYVDDVIEGYYYDSKFYKESTHTTEITPEAGKIYIDLSTDKTYRWGGSTYVVIASDLALGETSSTAYRGDRGKTAYDHAMDSGRLTTAKTSGLYKIATTSDGHVAGATPVEKSDIEALGIPGSQPDITGKADKDIIADDYSSSNAYAVGDRCIYNGSLYKCKTEIGSGGEAWNAAHWTEETIDEELTALNSKIETSDSISTGITGLSTAWKVAGIAFIKVYDLKPSANGTIGTLPTALRPKQGFNFPVTQLAGNVVAMLGITSNGEVSASGFDTSKYYYGMLVYPVA